MHLSCAPGLSPRCDPLLLPFKAELGRSSRNLGCSRRRKVSFSAFLPLLFPFSRCASLPAAGRGCDLPPWGLKRCSPATSWAFTLSWSPVLCSTAAAASSRHPEVKLPHHILREGRWVSAFTAVGTCSSSLALTFEENCLENPFKRDFCPVLPGCLLVPISTAQGKRLRDVTGPQEVPPPPTQG